MGTTSTEALRYPGTTDDVRPYEDIQNLATDVDAVFADVKAAMTSYTPTWGGTGVSVGNGTLAGWYKAVGKMVDVVVELTGGSTTNYGSGGYTFSLPFTAVRARQSGSAYYRDASGTSTGHYGGFVVVSTSLTTFTPFDISTHAQLQATVPVPWTGAGPDFWYMTLRYERA